MVPGGQPQRPYGLDLGSNPGEATLVRPIPASPGGTANQGQTNK